MKRQKLADLINGEGKGRVRPWSIESEYPPRGTNTEVDLNIGPRGVGRSFTYSSPHKHFVTGLNNLMLLLPELISRISPEEAEAYGEGLNVRQVAAKTTATESDGVILCDCSAGAIVVTLFSATKSGRELIIIKTDATSNAVTISCFGADDIEGSPSKTLSAQNEKAILLANGVSSWYDLGTSQV